MGYHALLQGIFSPQGSIPGLPHCRRPVDSLVSEPPGKPVYTHTHTHTPVWLFIWRCCTGFSLAEVSRDPSLVWCTGFPLQQLLLSCRAGSPAFRLQSVGSVAGAHRLSSSEACGVFLGRSLNPCLLHWQATALPLSHQGCPCALVFSVFLELHQLFVNCDACSGSCRDS